VLQCCSVLQRVLSATYCVVCLQCVVVSCNVLQCVAARIVCHVSSHMPALSCSELQCCSVLQIVLSATYRVVCL